MKTIILPGFSPHNREWAEEIKKRLKLGYPIEIIYWEHWKLGGGLRMKKELEKIKNIVEDNNFNIIAKSVGIGVTMRVLKEHKDKVKKIILCGIPSVSEDMRKTAKEVLKEFNLENIVCFQNTSDPFVSFQDLTVFMKTVSPLIKIIEKPGKDHNYPYFQDFEKFLTA